MKTNTNCINLLSAVLGMILLLTAGCEKFVTPGPPVNSINAENVYLDEGTAASALNGIYTTIDATPGRNPAIYTGLSVDELDVLSTNNTDYLTFYQNSLTPSTTGTGAGSIWSLLYANVYRCNAAIEGLMPSTSLTASVKQQLIGEAKFLRAYFYFFLINNFGDAPLLLSTDYKANVRQSRTPVVEIYQQILKDLKEAKELLSNDYANGKGMVTTGYNERVRPNRGTASALLSRVYLYMKNYPDAEAEASILINNKTQYDTVSLSNAFLKNSKEIIWATQPTGTGINTAAAKLFVLPNGGPSSANPISLSNHVVSSFEAGDKRKVVWVGNIAVGNKVFYYANKYKVSAANQPVTEYPILFRLSEQYLVRAEARAWQNKLSGARDDLNLIRKKAGLSPNITATTPDLLLAAVARERVNELFTEAHRWYDLKRTGKINEVMAIVTPQKGGIWKPEWALYPIPTSDILSSYNLTQNLGY